MAAQRTRVAILFGGRSAEHDVSVRSAASIISALPPDAFEAVPVAISRSGRWIQPNGAVRLLPPDAAARCGLGDVMLRPEPRRSSGFDVVFPALHGPFGEDGRLQGLLDLADVPYVGCGVLGSACGMDKDVMKRLFLSHGIPTLPHISVHWADAEAKMPEVEEAIGYPAFVKPANLGSSVGIRRAADRAGLEQALAHAGQFDDKLIVEPAVDGREIECGVLGLDPPRASVPGEIVTHEGFYDYETKYLTDSAELHVPAAIPPAITRAIRELSVRAFRAIGCDGLARVDFFLDTESGEPLVNEVNTMPGFTSISMYPRMWEASGVPFPELITRLIECAMVRHQRTRRLRVDRT